MKKEMADILIDRDLFPCKLSKEEGRVLRDIFQIDDNFTKDRASRGHLEDIEFRYTYSENRDTYILLEEYLFKENTQILDITQAIGINYYLNKVKNLN